MYNQLLSKILISIFGFFLLLTGCNNSELRLPIEGDKLIEVLCDVHIMEAALQNRSSIDKDSIARLYYDQVYEKHNIQEEDFLSTLETLEANPKQLEKIYSKVMIHLDTLEQYSYKSRYKKK